MCEEFVRFEGSRCSCPEDRKLGVQEEDYTTVQTLPHVIQFNLTLPLPLAEYCVQAVGDYVSEVTLGVGKIQSIQLTDGESRSQASKHFRDLEPSIAIRLYLAPHCRITCLVFEN